MLMLNGHLKKVNSVAFSPDGTRLASTSNDKTLRLWNVQTGNGVISTETEAVFEELAFTPDGNHLVARPFSGGIIVWNVRDRQKTRMLLPPTNDAHPSGFAVAPKSGRVVANERDVRRDERLVRVWNTATWKTKTLYRSTERTVLSGLAFDPTETRVAMSAGVVSAGTGAHEVRADFIYSTMRWSPKTAIIAGSRDFLSEVRLHDATTGRCEATLQVGRATVQDFGFSPDGRFLFAVSNDGAVRGWDTRTWSERPPLALDIGQLKCLAFSPVGQLVACGGHQGTIAVWDWHRGQ